MITFLCAFMLYNLIEYYFKMLFEKKISLKTLQFSELLSRDKYILCKKYEPCYIHVFKFQSNIELSLCISYMNLLGLKFSVEFLLKVVRFNIVPNSMFLCSRNIFNHQVWLQAFRL